MNSTYYLELAGIGTGGRDYTFLNKVLSCCCPPPELIEEIIEDLPATLFDNAKNSGLILPTTTNYPKLSEEYETNEVFAKYICPITRSIIRYPVAIKTGNGCHYYELDAIYFWVEGKGTNPLTHTPLAVEDLCVDVNALLEIQNEMDRLNLLH